MSYCESSATERSAGAGGPIQYCKLTITTMLALRSDCLASPAYGQNDHGCVIYVPARCHPI